METKPTFALKLFSSLFFYLYLSISLMGQNGAAVFETQSRELTLDISRLNEQASQLRANGRTATDPKARDLMLKEAGSMEKESMNKQVQLYKLGYSYKLKSYTDNKTRISTLQKLSTDKVNSNHNKYLVEESGKNARLAAQLAQEAELQNSSVLAIGVLDNADEKIELAISQQNQVIDNLEKSNSKLAKNK